MLDVTLQTQTPGQQRWSLWAGSVQPEDSRSSLPSGGKEQAANGPRVGARGGREEVDRLTLTLTHSETADLMVHPASTRWRCFTSQQEVVTMEMSPASARPDVTFVGVCVRACACAVEHGAEAEPPGEGQPRNVGHKSDLQELSFLADRTAVSPPAGRPTTQRYSFSSNTKCLDVRRTKEGRSRV